MMSGIRFYGTFLEIIAKKYHSPQNPYFITNHIIVYYAILVNYIACLCGLIPQRVCKDKMGP